MIENDLVWHWVSMRRRKGNRVVKLDMDQVVKMMDKMNAKVVTSAWQNDHWSWGDVDGTSLQLQIEAWWNVVLIRKKPGPFDMVEWSDRWFQSSLKVDQSCKVIWSESVSEGIQW